MNITVTFDSLTEVKEFAAVFSRQATEVKAPEPVIPQDITAPAAAPQPAGNGKRHTAVKSQRTADDQDDLCTWA